MTGYEKLADLNKLPLFAGLSEKQIDWLRNHLYARMFPANKEMIITGMPGDLMYIILSGTVKVYVPQPDGEEVIIAILGPGDPVGEMSMMGQDGRSANVITLEETYVLWMNRASFKEAINSIPALSQNLIHILFNRLRNSTGQIQALAALDVNGRLVHQILSYADRYGEPGPHGAIVIPIRLTQSDLAALVGASRKRVNQAMVNLKHAGCISIDAGYHITIHDRALLEDCLS